MRNEHRTLNIEHPTSNWESRQGLWGRRGKPLFTSMFNVQCSMFDVRYLVSQTSVRCLVLRALVIVLLTSNVIYADDVYSNGLGGGRWSDGGSWRGGAVPASNDLATISGNDRIVVDLKDPNRIACKELRIDPQGMLTFGEGAGRHVLLVGGIIESYGAIRLDMRRSDGDAAELRLAGTTREERKLHMVRGASLVMAGRIGLMNERSNVVLSSGPVITDTNAPPVDPTGELMAQDGSSLDFQRVEIRNVRLHAEALDNTGVDPNERLRIIGCRFAERANIGVRSCDTAMIVDNVFDSDLYVDHAILIQPSVLSDVRGNTVRGQYGRGIVVNGNEAAVAGNSVEGAVTGYSIHGCETLLLQQNMARSCKTGYNFERAESGMAAECIADACEVGFRIHNNADLQLIHCKALNVESNGTSLVSVNNQMQLLNCDLAADRMSITEQAQNRTVSGEAYLVVRVTGHVPTDSQVEVVTANPTKALPPRALDPNVRNSPSPLSRDGWTPQPQTRAALTVRTWIVGADNQRLPPPAYKLRVLGPRPGRDKPPPVLKEIEVTPTDAWYRLEPNVLQATVEIEL